MLGAGKWEPGDERKRFREVWEMFGGQRSISKTTNH